MTTSLVQLRETGSDTNVVVIVKDGAGVIGWYDSAANKAYNLLGDLVTTTADELAAADAVESEYDAVIGELADSEANSEVLFTASPIAFAGAVYFDDALGVYRRVSATGSIAGQYATLEMAKFAAAKAL